MSRLRAIFTDVEMRRLIEVRAKAHAFGSSSPAKLVIRKPAFAGKQPTSWLTLTPGAHLWVAEGFTVTKVEPPFAEGHYKADGAPFIIAHSMAPALSLVRARQCHSMPVEASRFTLRVLGQKVELDTAVIACEVLDGNIEKVGA